MDTLGSGGKVEEYISRPVIIKAIQYTLETREEVIKFVGDNINTKAINNDGEEYDLETLRIYTLEGTMFCSLNDYVIRGLKGEFYPCKPDIFRMKYDLMVPLDLGQPAKESDFH